MRSSQALWDLCRPDYLNTASSWSLSLQALPLTKADWGH